MTNKEMIFTLKDIKEQITGRYIINSKNSDLDLSYYANCVASDLADAISRIETIEREIEKNNTKSNQTILNVRGIDCREVDNDKFSAELFAPLSVYEKWKESKGGLPSEDDLFYGYVEDEQFYALTDEEFEELVNEDFD